MQKGDKLYLITRKDLSAGYQAVQSGHALVEFTMEHPEIADEWHKNSNYLCLLSVDNENDLYTLVCRAKDENLKLSVFREEDIGNEITAICLEPGERSKKLCSNLKLALR